MGEPDHGSVAVGFQLGVDALPHCNQRRRSVKNLKTVSGDALTWRSIIRTFPGCGQADPSSDSASLASRSSRPAHICSSMPASGPSAARLAW